MNPTKMPHTTRTLGAPADWCVSRHGECIGLPVTDADGVMLSYWKPTWKERLRVLAGRPIRLVVAGSAHSPVMLDVEP